MYVFVLLREHFYERNVLNLEFYYMSIYMCVYMYFMSGVIKRIQKSTC